MTKKENFINIIQTIVFDNDCTDYAFSDSEWNDALEYFESLKTSSSASTEITDNGKKVLRWMQDNKDKMSNMFTAKEIGEGLFISGRSVSGTLKKLVTDEYVSKEGKNPIQYSLTDKGTNYLIS